jgi:GxxExxY protein
MTDSATICDFEEDRIAKAVVDSAIRIHKHFGPGLLESLYEACLCHALVKLGHKVLCQKPVPVEFEGQRIDVAYRLDLLVDDKVLVEVKSVEKLLPIHEAQILSYMKLAGIRLGLLLNFNEILLKNGIKRMVFREKLGALGVLGGKNTSEISV